MRGVILAPWRGGDPFREKSWAILRPYYESMGYDLFVSDSNPKLPFNISEANNLLAEMAGDWDVAMFIGTDCLIPKANVHRGMAYAHEHQVLTLPHDEFYSMTRAGQLRVGYGEMPTEKPRKWRQWSKKAASPNSGGKLYAPSGVLMMPRSVWDRIGGYDQGFTSWGFEDAALLVEAGEFHRLAGPMYHYWHPSRRHTGTPAGVKLWKKKYLNRPPRQYLADEDRWIGGNPKVGAWA